MKTPILIKITGTHSHEKDLIIQEFNGFFCETNNIKSIIYNETDENSKTTKSTITFGESEITIDRKGAVIGEIEYKKRRKTNASFTSSGININYSIFTKILEYEISKSSGWLEIHYDLHLGEEISQSSVIIEYMNIDHD